MAALGKLKILCLHGYRQDANTFKEKLGGFRKSIKNVADLAPHKVPVTDEKQNNISDTEQHGWWFSQLNNTYIADEKTDICKGFEESLDCVRNAFATMGPFDGILGFSQGAALVALICALSELGEFAHPFSFAILVAGFKSRSTPHDKYFVKKIKITTLQVIGETDRVIPKSMSEELLEYFEKPKVIFHPGGHYIPTNSSFRNSYQEFLNDALQNKNS